MSLPTVFLRNGTTLPQEVSLTLASFCDGWMEIAASSAEAVDNVIRQAGWHFVWLTDSGSRVAFGLSKEAACRNAAVLVLSQIGERFNTAELGRVSVTKYPGFYVAKVVLHTRQIQRHASLGLVDEMLLREVMA